jgi:GntR family transcriptional regulator
MAVNGFPTQSGGLEAPARAGDARPVPLYEHVKRLLSEAILMGHWAPNTVLPGEVVLAAQYGVAVGTVRRALADLVTAGLLMRRPKIGTVVTGRTPQHSLRFFYQFFRLHAADGTLLRSEARVLSVSVAQAAPDAEFFAGESVIRIHRLRLIADKPVMHEQMMLPAARLPDFPTIGADIPPLLYHHLLATYAIRITAVRESLVAQLATAEDCALLALEAPCAILAIDDTAYDQTGLPTIVAHHRFVTRDLRYINEIR